MADKEKEKNATGGALAGIGKVICKLRGILLSIPVLLAAIVLAVENSKRLPETVGINLLANGEYQWMVAREAAVRWPILFTALCLVMVLCSKKVVYPLLISVFSLVIPILIWVTNVFPA